MPAKLSDTAYDELLLRILTLQYAPGSLLSEEKLVAELGFSRTPIRSALVRLEQEHLVQTISKKGILVSEITPEGIRDVFNLRDLIEPYAIREFGANFKKEQLLHYLDIFSRNYTDNDDRIVYDNDSQFHADIVHLTGNTFLCAFYDSLQKLLCRISVICGDSIENRVETSNKEHAEIVLALLQDETETAASLLERHLKAARASAYQALLLRKK